MRVCIDVSAAVAQGAGIARYEAELVRCLRGAEPGLDLHLFYNGAPAARLPPGLEDLPRHRVGPRDKPWRLWQLVNHYRGRDLSRRLLPPLDLFHGADHIIPPLGRLPTVVTVHDLTFLHYPHYHTRLSRLYLRLAVPVAVRRSALVIAGASSTARDLADTYGVPSSKVRVVPLGVAGTFAAARTRSSPDCVREWFGLARPYVLFVGTLEPRKDLPTLLRAYERLPGEGRPQLVLAGQRGWKVEGFLRQLGGSPARGDVVLLGRVPEERLPALYAGALAFVFPSVYEGFGLPPLEAMASGTPVVVARSSSLPEIVGDHGLYFTPGDADELAARLRDLLRDPELRSNLGQRGAERAARFTWEETARQTLAVYHEALERAGPPSRSRGVRSPGTGRSWRG